MANLHNMVWIVDGRLVQLDDILSRPPEELPPGDVLCATVDGQLRQLTVGDPPRILIIK